jgi:hypothetical protein
MARRVLRPTSIQIEFVDASGNVSSTMKIEIPTPKRIRKPRAEDWDKATSLRRFQYYLSRGGNENLGAALVAVDHHGCMAEAFEMCRKGNTPNAEKVKRLLYLWNTYGLSRMPKALKERQCVFVDALRHFITPYSGAGLTLYRGQERKEQYGIAWTSRKEIAATSFHSGRLEPVVLMVEALPDMIVAHVPSHIHTPKTIRDSFEFEDEYILDPRKLSGRVSLAVVPRR